MTNHMTMITVNIYDFKMHLSEYLSKVEADEKIIICKRNLPVAELRALSPQITTARPIGLAKNKMRVPASFFEELPDDVIKTFDGKNT